MIAQLAPPSTWFSLTKRALLQADRLNSAIENAGGELQLITNQADLIQFKKKRDSKGGGVGGLLAIEEMHALDIKEENLEVLFKSGYRMMGPAHFFDTLLAVRPTALLKAG